MIRKVILIAIMYSTFLHHGTVFSQETISLTQQQSPSGNVCSGPFGPGPCEVVQQDTLVQQQARQIQLLSCPEFPPQMGVMAKNKVLAALENLGRLPTGDFERRVIQTTRHLASILNSNELIYLNTMLIAAYCNSLNYQNDIALKTKEEWLKRFDAYVINARKSPREVKEERTGERNVDLNYSSQIQAGGAGSKQDGPFGSKKNANKPTGESKVDLNNAAQIQAGGAGSKQEAPSLSKRNAPGQFVPAPPEKAEGRVYPVWYGTNRKPLIAEDGLKGYSNKRDSGKIHFGKCAVIIPKDHKFGSIGPIWYMRWSREDAPLSVRPPVSLTKEEFYKDMRNAMETDATSRNVLVYIHGFNVDFNEAAIRAGQIGFDLKVPGVTAFFSWPSKGELSPGGYASDLSSIEDSEDQITEFLISIYKEVKADRIHIVAHSMGNYGLIRALNGATAQANLRGGVKFGQIFLAAPDVDADLFKRLAVVYPTVSERTTLYVSSKDRALEASSWLRGYNRAGYTPPVSVLSGIDTIEVSKIDLTLLGHGYFSDAASVLHDMHDLIMHNDSPLNRPRLNKYLTGDGHPYWRIQ